MGLGALAHTLVTSVRRRRVELGILKSVGFVRRQVAGTVVWQTSAILVASLVAGIPVGLAAGRWAWLVFADQLGFVPEAVVPMVGVLLTIPSALVIANVIAALPARAAARTKAAAILRAE
jgi:ABC-type antimicrobial peptide transport system permease subunit